jgi:hypothetical protein
MITLLMERRVLGAVEFVDATTGATVRRPLRVESPARTWWQRSGLLVIADAPGLHAHTTAFARPPEEPPVGSVAVRLQVSDPSREYQPTTVSVALPRSPAPDAANSVLRPQTLRLWRTGAAPASPNWTVYRATLLLQGAETPVAGALVQLVAAGHTQQALSDATGQVTLALVGQPLFTLEGGGTLSRTLQASLSLHLPRPADTRLADVAAEIARLAAQPPDQAFNRTLPTGAAFPDTLAVAP